jgi:small subunit ribosomal protein S17
MADKKNKKTEETPVAPAEIEEAVVEDVEVIAAEVTAVEEAIEEAAAEAVAADLEVDAEAEEAAAEAVAEGAITPGEGVEAVEVIEEAVAEAVAEVVVEAVIAEEAVEEAAAEVIAEEIEEAAAVEEAVAEQATAPAPQSGPKVKKKRLPRALRPQKTRPTRTKPAERKPIVRLEKPEHERGRSQERQGTVVSAAMDKTIVVKVEVTKSHRKYKKVIRRSVKFRAHDEGNTAKLGDVVRIVETRPLSATKRWRLTEIVKVAE